MAADQTAQAKLTLDIKDFVAGTAEAQAAWARLRAFIDTPVADPLNRATQGLGEFHSTLATGAPHLQLFLGQVTAITAGLVGFNVLKDIEQGVASFFGGMIKANSTMEQFEVTMAAMIGSMGQLANYGKVVDEEAAEATRKLHDQYADLQQRIQDSEANFAASAMIRAALLTVASPAWHSDQDLVHSVEGDSDASSECGYARRVSYLTLQGMARWVLAPPVPRGV